MAVSTSTLSAFTAGLRLMVHSLLIQPNRIDPAGWGATTQGELSSSNYASKSSAYTLVCILPQCGTIFKMELAVLSPIFHLNLNYFALPFRRQTQPKESSERGGGVGGENLGKREWKMMRKERAPVKARGYQCESYSWLARCVELQIS